MPLEIMTIRNSQGHFVPATQHDHELAVSYPAGQPVRVKLTKPNARNYKFHCKYWTGLLGLAFEYWEPEGGFISESERSILHKFALYLSSLIGHESTLVQAAADFLGRTIQSRQQRIETPEKSLQALHNFVKIESGWFEYEVTPAGIKKVAKSISFASMSEAEFRDFYKAAFSVCWRFILSRSFPSEAEAEEAMQKLMDLERRG